MDLRRAENDFKSVSHQILDISNKGVPRIDFLNEISKKLLEFSGYDAIELLLLENGNYLHTGVTVDEEFSFHYDVVPSTEIHKKPTLQNIREKFKYRHIHRAVINRQTDPTKPYFTKNGSFFGSGDLRNLDLDLDDSPVSIDESEIVHSSVAIIPIYFGNSVIGTIQYTSSKKNVISEHQADLLEKIAHNLGIAVINHRTQAALQERVKELSCLYRITQASESEAASIDDFLSFVVDILPPGWQYPEITTAKIEYNNKVYLSRDYSPGGQKQVAEIVIQGKKKGYIEVSYTELRPPYDEGPFLREERNLIQAIARQLALIIERKEAQKERLELQDQLRHADRLAIIGQLAAGVAHELNEPLGSILGFAQLIKKSTDFKEQSNKDLEKIIKASLHAREIIRKLLVFAREINTNEGYVNLNDIAENGLYFLESRCQKAGIEIIKKLDPKMPAIVGDEAQMHQLLINLVVNSIQAMPNGGKLIIETYLSKNNACLAVEDNGVGMTDEVKSKMFVPFFTTKEINEGTGLGLAVVHGIVTSYKGRIKVDSSPGMGTRFEIKFPVL